MPFLFLDFNQIVLYYYLTWNLRNLGGKMPKKRSDTVTQQDILWLKHRARNWKEASSAERAEIKEDWGPNSGEFIRILELINAAHKGKPNPKITATALRAWRAKNKKISKK